MRKPKRPKGGPNWRRMFKNRTGGNMWGEGDVDIPRVSTVYIRKGVVYFSGSKRKRAPVDAAWVIYCNAFLYPALAERFGRVFKDGRAMG